MKRFLSTHLSHFFYFFLALTLALSGAIPSHANEKGAAWNEDTRAYSDGWPWPSLPNWWNRSDPWIEQQKLTNLRLGFWLACRPDWSMNDCIDSIKVYNAQGTNLGSVTYVPNPRFNPFENKQRWYQAKENGDGALIDNSSVWVDGANFPGSFEGHWLLPEGVSTASGNRKLVVNVQRMLGSLQVLIQSQIESDKEESLPEGLTFEMVLKSKELGKRARWVHSNGKDPQVLFPTSETVMIRGITAKLPWPPIDANVCKAGNDVKAVRDAVFMGVNIFLTSPNAGGNDAASEVIIGTNGWWCFGGLNWDSTNRNLEAKVGAAHFYSDGTVVDGWLEIKIKASRVREWWGIAPEEATGYARVEVVYEDGVRKTASVTAKYIREYDWIDLRAYGFTYSSPAVRITLEKPEVKPSNPVSTPSTQPEATTPVSTSPTPAQTSNPVAAPTAQAKPSVQPKKTTITCVKGKTVRKVTGAKPKCPAGFTLKR